MLKFDQFGNAFGTLNFDSYTYDIPGHLFFIFAVWIKVRHLIFH